MSTDTTNTNTSSQSEIRVLTPKERLEAGYQKSSNALVADIVKEYGTRLDNGTKVFRYIKKWNEDGYFMSAVYAQGDCMKPGINTILQPESEINRFWDDVRTKLVVEYGIHSHEWKINYYSANNTWYTMKFDVTMSLDAASSQATS
jgi:hypothetical protein